MPKNLSMEDQLAAAQSALDQKDAQIDALNERVNDLAGFQREAVDGRDAVARLQAQLDAANLAAEQSQRAALAAEARSRDAAQALNADAELVAAAQALVAAIKTLS